MPSSRAVESGSSDPAAFYDWFRLSWLTWKHETSIDYTLLLCSAFLGNYRISGQLLRDSGEQIQLSNAVSILLYGWLWTTLDNWFSIYSVILKCHTLISVYLWTCKGTGYIQSAHLFCHIVWAGWVVGEVDWELAEWQNSEGCHQQHWV